MSEQLDALLAMLTDDLRREIEQLRRESEWAYATQPFQVGDEVVIQTAPSIGKSSGWWTCREFLVEGSTGTVTDVHFYSDRWGVVFLPDVQWDASERHGRRLSDRPASFYFRPELLRRRKKRDHPLTVPKDAKPWRTQ